MTPSRSLAAAQTIPIRGDVAANIEQHLRLASVAAAERTHVLVFPELSLTGYELDLAEELAFSEGDARLAPFVEVAAAASMIVIVGAPVRIGTQLHIGAFIVAPDGTVDVHTKQYLGAFSREVSPDGVVPPAESTVFVVGSRSPLLRFHGNSAAIGVCAESLGKGHVEQAARRGAEIYLTAHFGIPLDVDFRHQVLSGHAVRHAISVVFANYGGPTGGLAAGGRSAIWSETGALLAALEPSGAGVVFASQSQAGWTAKTVAVA
jgi:predicted amidohydrolase